MGLCFACFGNETLFSVMKGYHGILDYIRQQLTNMKFEDAEDTDELPTYHPNLRRLAFILFQKTNCEQTEGG